MKQVNRCLMWAHYLYLLLLPMLAVFAAARLGHSDGFKVILILAGALPACAYCLFLANGYTLPNSLPVALLVVLAVPAQIGASVLLFGGKSLWLFFAESAAVEIGSLLPALIAAKLRHPRDERRVTLWFVPLVVAGVSPFILVVFSGYGGVSLWLVLFITAYLTSFREYMQLYAGAIEAHSRSGQLQEIEMRFDGGYLARKLGFKDDIGVISPLYRQRKANEVDWRPAIVGLVFFILFLTAAGTSDLLR